MNQRLEDYIRNCNSNFSELSKYASAKGIVERYYSTTKGKYRKYFYEKDSLEIEKFAIRPLINDFLRKMAKFQPMANQDVSAGTRMRFFIVKPAAMISFPRAVIKYL